MRIFLSSTFADLYFERRAVEAVIDRMALTYVGMEHFGSFSNTPLERSLQAVRDSGLVIVVLGRRYGSIARDQLVSFTEAELREALRLAKPVLAYVSSVSRYPNQPPTDRRLEALRAELSHTLGVSEFESAEDLAWKVATDLHRELPAPPASDAARHLSQQLGDLVEIFEQRARVIKQTLSKHYKHSQVNDFFRDFNELHDEHITYLKNGQFVVAHEVLNRIHALSAGLERGEFWASERDKPGISLYSLNFAPGLLIQTYGKYISAAGTTGFDTHRSRVSAEQQYLEVLSNRTNEAQ
jgi:hypothetical protein